MELDFFPTEGSLDQKVDLVQGRLDIALPQATDKNFTQHTGYKVVEHVDPRCKEIDLVDAGVDLGLAKVDLGLAKVDLANMHINLVTTKVDLIATKADFVAGKVDLAAAKVSLVRKSMRGLLNKLSLRLQRRLQLQKGFPLLL